VIRVDGEANMLNFDKYEVLTFDCYGTLIDWESGILSAIRPVLSAHNLNLTDDQILELYAVLESQAEKGAFKKYKSILSMVMEGFGDKLGFIPNKEELGCLAESLKSWQPFPDTVQALNGVKRKYRLGIISNIDDDLFSFSAKHLQVEFDWIISAEQVKSYKPSLNNFNLAIERIGLPKGKILHVAQSLYHDILPAKKLGLATVWVNRRHAKGGFGATPLAHSQPDLEVPNLRTLVSRIGLE
jgi:2-haloacid dehalogenase